MNKVLVKSLAVAALFLCGGLCCAAEKLISREEFSAERVRSITVKASCGNAEVLGGTGGKIVVEVYSSKSATDAEIALRGDGLFVDATEWTPFKNPPNVRIFVPSDVALDDLRVSISSGNTRAKGFSCKNVQIVASSGKIDAENITCTNCELSASSGGINLDEIKAENDVKTSASSGSIDADEVFCGTFSAKTSSGGITADDVSCSIFDVQATSGKIEAGDLLCQKFRAETTSGKIVLELAKMFAEDSSLESSSGGILLELPKKNDGYTAFVSTSSGTFSDEFVGMRGSNLDGASSVYNGGGAKVTLKSKSGGIKIKKGK